MTVCVCDLDKISQFIIHEVGRVLIRVGHAGDAAHRVVTEARGVLIAVGEWRADPANQFEGTLPKGSLIVARFCAES